MVWPTSNKIKKLQKEAVEHNTQMMKEVYDDDKYKGKVKKGLRGLPRLF